MILTRSDFPGSLNDKPEYMNEYGINYQSFLNELKSLCSQDPKHAGWDSSLYYCEVYCDSDGYRIALPSKYHPFKLKDRRYFDDFLLSETVFPNQYQARSVASRIMREKIGN